MQSKPVGRLVAKRGAWNIVRLFALRYRPAEQDGYLTRDVALLRRFVVSGEVERPEALRDAERAELGEFHALLSPVDDEGDDAMKPVDEVLDALRMESTVFSRMTLSGDWGFAKDELKGAPFHLLLSGRACLQTESGNFPLELGAGDIVVLPRGERHRLLARAEAPAVAWKQVIHRFGWQHWKPGTRFKAVDLRYGEGGQVTTLISGVFAFEAHRRNPLLAALPPVMLVRGDAETDAARAVSSITSLLETELLSGKPGAESVAGRLADILFIQVVRHHIADGAALPRGWLRGMADPEIGPALGLIHSAPEDPWSVASMAHALGMSRSRFAARFQEIVGQGPVTYLTQWRMYTAAGRLAEGKIALAKLADSVGYRSDVAFSKAFKRWAGLSPVEYHRRFYRDATKASQASSRDGPR